MTASTAGIVANLTELIGMRELVKTLLRRPKSSGMIPGTYISPRQGRGMDFDYARNYQAGDDIRHMDWRSTARSGKAHVKIYQEERERPVILVVDCNPSMIFGTRIAFKSVIAARLAALLAWTAIQYGDKVGGMFFCATTHHEFLPRSREVGILPMLRALSIITEEGLTSAQQPPKPLLESLARLRRVVRPGSHIILLSDFYSLDEAAMAQLLPLRRQNSIKAYQICDLLETDVPRAAAYPITDGATARILDLREPAVVAGYKKFCENRVQNTASLFKSLNVHCQLVNPYTDLSRLVVETYFRGSYG